MIFNTPRRIVVSIFICEIAGRKLRVQCDKILVLPDFLTLQFFPLIQCYMNPFSRLCTLPVVKADVENMKRFRISSRNTAQYYTPFGPCAPEPNKLELHRMTSERQNKIWTKHQLLPQLRFSKKTVDSAVEEGQRRTRDI